MKQFFFFLIVTIVFTACSKKDHDNTTVNSVDIEFMQQVSYANYAAEDAAILVPEHADDNSVKLFATDRITTAGKLQSDVDSVGAQLNIQLPAEPDSAHKENAAYLSNLYGHAFDTAYINAQVADYQITINIYNKELSKGNNAQIINLARMYLPVMVDQSQQAKDIQALLE